LKHRSPSARLALLLLVGFISTLCLSGCHTPLYYYPKYNFAGRAIPPSGLLQRVLATYTSNGSSGGSEILDGLRDLRFNVQNTIPTFTISGYSGGYPSTIYNFPEQQAGYILDSNSGTVQGINYAKENTTADNPSFGPNTPSVGVSPDGSRFVGATTTNGVGNNNNQLLVYAGGTTYALNLPNVYRVAINPGNSVILAMTRNSNSLYRVIQIPQTTSSTTPFPPGSIDCEPLINPVYCVVPVAGTYDRPDNAYFSLDGNTVYVLNAGPENGGATASVSVLQTSALTFNNIPTVNPLAASAPSPLAALPVANPIPVPGGVTEALSDGSTLYLAGQSLRPDGLFTGNLTVMPLSTYVPGAPVSISDGTHTRMLFADDNTLFIGSSNCASGERAKTGQNVNCLTMVQLGGTTPAATVIPVVTQGSATTVPYPNTNGNPYYYGSLTGLCWVQGYHKIFTAYGGQIHAFYTGGAITDRSDPAVNTTPAAGTEINNTNITVQGTVLDVAYMDALTNSAN